MNIHNAMAKEQCQDILRGVSTLRPHMDIHMRDTYGMIILGQKFQVTT